MFLPAFCHLIFLCLILVAASGCAPKANLANPRISNIHIIDRDGLSETISNPERLTKFEGVDFKGTQPYQKVLRVFERDPSNNIIAHVTSYHPNGQLKQYLEICNGRAFGLYQEWYPTGIIKVEAHVIGGQPDITTAAEKSWLFEGVAKAWDENGHLIAEIPYLKGVIDGIALYYHPNGKLWKRVPFHQNELQGTLEIFTDDGLLLQTVNYVISQREGLSVRYWGPNQVACREVFSEGRLLTGSYYNSSGEQISSIDNGIGHRTVFAKDGVAELQEFRDGLMQGEVKVFSRSDRLLRLYHVKKGLKHGDEFEYFDFLVDGKLQPKLLTPWFEGKIQGFSKTWYDNGVQESQREMSSNSKMGLSTAWYRDGNLMLIEEYDNNKLVRGEYYARGNKNPVSFVTAGKGTATLFDSEGHFTRRVTYHEGAPNE